MDIKTSDFFAPAQTGLLDGLIAQYRQKRDLIERFHGDFQDGDIGRALVYFCQRQDDRYPNFDLQIAICALNAEFWRSALALTDVYKYMPQARKDEWHDQLTAWKEPRYKYGSDPARDLPDFTEDAAKAALMTWLQERPKYLAERVEGVFRSLSKEHITNCPQGFSKRMIMAGLVDSWGHINWQKAGIIDDLRMVLSKFMDRGEYPVNGSASDLEVVRRVNGEWFSLDGGALRIRVYNGVGTAHIEVHPEMAWRLNEILSYLYPAAIPESFRRKPVKAKKIKDFQLFDDALPFAVCRVLAGAEHARYLNPDRGYRSNTFIQIPKAIQIKGDDKATRKAAEEVLEALGGVKVNRDGSHHWQFDYEPLATIHGVAASGRIPNQKSHQFYPTPEDVAQLAIEYASEGDRAGQWLEPSAGQGGLVKFMPVGRTTAVEISPLHCEIIKKSISCDDVICADFMEWKPCRNFARVVMNPPYSEGRWQAHTERAAGLVEAGGRLVAILPASAKGKFDLPGFSCRYSETLKNRFAGTGVDVVILVADKRN